MGFREFPTKTFGLIFVSIGISGALYGAGLHLSGDPSGVGIGAIIAACLIGPGAAFVTKSKIAPTLGHIWAGPTYDPKGGKLPKGYERDENE